MRKPITTGKFYRTLVDWNDDHKMVLTIELIGIENQIIGVKCSLFDPDNCIERGAFLTINQN